MFKIFDTIEEFNAKNEELNLLLGYPNEVTMTYAEPIMTTDDKFAMQVLDGVAYLFDGLVENININVNNNG